MRETVDRLRQSQEENEMVMRRRDELEARIAALETEYEELLEKTIHDEETSNVDITESMSDLKVRFVITCSLAQTLKAVCRTNSRLSMPQSAMPMLGRFKT